MDKMLRLFGIVFLVIASFNLSFGGLLENGDFESPPNPSAMSGTKVNGQNSIPSWQTTGFVEYIKTGYKQGDMVFVVPEGNYAVRLGEDASIKQRVLLRKGGFYAVTFSFARTCAQDEKLIVDASNRSGELPLQTMYSNTGYDSYAWGFKATENEVLITLRNPARNEEDPTCGPLLDTVGISELTPPRPTRDNLVKNGDFEEGPIVSRKSNSGILIPSNIEDDHSPLPGWMIESLKAVKYIDSPYFSIPSGKKAVELVAGRESALAQTIRTVVGKTYVMTFSVGDARNGCSGDLEVEAFAGKNIVRVPYKSAGEGGFVKGKLVFEAVKERTRLRFLSNVYSMTKQGSLCGPVVDDVRIVGVRFPRRHA